MINNKPEGRSPGLTDVMVGKEIWSIEHSSDMDEMEARFR